VEISELRDVIIVHQNLPRNAGGSQGSPPTCFDTTKTRNGSPRDAAVVISLDTPCGLKEDAVRASEAQKRRACARGMLTGVHFPSLVYDREHQVSGSSAEGAVSRSKAEFDVIRQHLRPRNIACDIGANKSLHQLALMVGSRPIRATAGLGPTPATIAVVNCVAVEVTRQRSDSRRIGGLEVGR
jgi:hypothetical protein